MLPWHHLCDRWLQQPQAFVLYSGPLRKKARCSTANTAPLG